MLKSWSVMDATNRDGGGISAKGDHKKMLATTVERIGVHARLSDEPRLHLVCRLERFPTGFNAVSALLWPRAAEPPLNALEEIAMRPPLM